MSICCLIFQDDEPTPVVNYEQRKLLEERRLANILEQINTLFLQLSPPGPSATTESVTDVHPKEKNLTMIFNKSEVRFSMYSVCAC